MSVQNAVSFIRRLDGDSALTERISTRADFVAVAQELNLPFSEDELNQAVQEYAGDVSPEDLKATSAGLLCFYCAY